MKRVAKLFNQVIDRENLRLAVSRALRGKRHRPDAREFVCDLDRNIQRMQQQLLADSFPLGRFHQFEICEPKRRIITAPCFPERVVHHALVNVCEPVFERWLIDDTFACRPGKGRVTALRRALSFARRHAFFLKLDIRKYFDSVPHDRLLARLQRLFKDQRLLQLFARIIGSFRGEAGRGLPIGSLTSQHFANFYLGWFDRQAKDHWRIPGYVRYMDDMLLCSDSKQQLMTCLQDGRDFLREQLRLELKPTPYVNRTAHGVDFLGCRVSPKGLTLNRRSRVRFRRRLVELEEQFRAGHLDELTLQQRATALVAFTKSAGAASWQFRDRVVQQLLVSGQEARTG